MITVVIPMFRNPNTLTELCRRIRKALQPAGWTLEILFIDDGSKDDSWRVLVELAAGHCDVCGARLPYNEGQHTAALVGLSRARGKWCVVLDADLQDPPEAIPALIAAAEDCDTVFAGRTGRYQGLGRSLSGRFYRRILSALVAVPRDAGIFFATRRTEVERILDLRVSEISLVAMLGLIGSRSASVPVRREMAKNGSSAYTSVLRVRAGLRMLRCIMQHRFNLVRSPIRNKVEALNRQCTELRPR